MKPIWRRVVRDKFSSQKIKEINGRARKGSPGTRKKDAQMMKLLEFGGRHYGGRCLPYWKSILPSSASDLFANAVCGFARCLPTNGCNSVAFRVDCGENRNEIG